MFFAIDPACHSDADAAVRRVINVFAPAAGQVAVLLLAILAMPVLAASAADNASPVITVPGDKTYEQGETITPFGVTVTDADNDPVTVTVTGLPSGLSYTSGQVRGTVSASASAQAYTVTISADDEANAKVTATFTITVTDADQSPPADQISPTVTISGPTAPRRGTFLVRFAFSEPVTGFEQGDVTVGNGFVREFAGSGARYRAKIRITPGFSGTVTVDVAANVAADAAGNPNTAASRFSVEGDQTRPTVSINGPAGLQKGPFDVTFTFSESVTGFEKGDVTVGNGSVASFSGSGRSYRSTIAPAGAGTVTVDVAAHVAKDAPGNPNMPAKRFSVKVNRLPAITAPDDKTYEQGEAITAFGITATDADGDPVTVALTGLPSGLSYTGGQVQGTVSAGAAAQAYTVTIKADDGVNSAVTATFTVTVTESDQTPPADQSPPTVTISGPTAPQRGTFIVRITFSEPVTGFEQGDVTVGNGFVKEFSGSGAGFRAKIRITPGFSGTVTVDVAANVAADEAGNPNLAAGRFSVEGDQTRPRVTISGPRRLQKGPFEVTFTFTESMKGFEQGDVTVGNGSVTSFSGSGRSYQATIAPAGAGTVTVDVPAHVATDAPGNPNMPAKRYSVKADLASSNAPPVIADPGDKTYEQGETITAFGITVTDADGDTPTVTVTGLPSGLSYANGQVSGTVAADATAQTYTATISADDGVNPAVAATFTITVTESDQTPPADQTPPTVTISGPTAPQRGTFIVRITFSEPVTGFEQGDVTVGNGFVRELSGSGAGYRAKIRITPGFSGTVTVDVAANVAADEAGNPNLAAGRFSVEGDQTRPRVTISGPRGLQKGPFEVTFTFTESMKGFEQGDVTVGNGSVTSFSGSGRSYQATIAPAGAGTVTVDVPAHVATDATGNPNMPAKRYSVKADLASSNAPPVIADPGDKTYEQGETITAFGITVTDADSDPLTLTVTGLPPGLSYTNDEVQGTVAADAAVQAYTVTITADDGVNAAVTATFTVMVTPPLPTIVPLAITLPENKIYWQSETITPFGITATTPSGEPVTVTVTGLPPGLSYTNSEVQGTVAADAAAQAYRVTITADDGVNAAVTAAFTIKVIAKPLTLRSQQGAPTVTISGPTTVQTGTFQVDITFSEPVTGFEKTDVTVGNGRIIAWAGTGPVATMYVKPAATGTVTVDVAADVAVDEDGNGNTAATRFSVAADVDAPTVTISGPTTVQTGSFVVTITFSKSVTGFEQADVTVGNGRIWAWAESGSTVVAYVAPVGSGTVTVDVAANVAVDADNNGNRAATQFSVEADVDEPTVTISGPSAAQAGAFDVTITFSESMTGFEQADVTVGNGSVTDFSGSGASYTATITPSATGAVTVDVAANVAVGTSRYGNTAAKQFSVEADLDPPTVTISGPSDTQAGLFAVSITISESVTRFGGADVTVGNGVVTDFSGSGTNYTATITPTTASGTVTVDVAAGAARDRAGHGNTAASRYSVQVALVSPTVIIRGPSGKQVGPFGVTITFSESVTGFESADVTVGNGAVTAFSGTGASYAATITPSANGTVTVDVAAGAAVDSGGDGNLAARRFIVDVDRNAPTVTISGPAEVQTGTFIVTITFSEPVTGFESADVKVGNGRVFANNNFASTPSGAALIWIEPAATGTVTVDVPANVAVGANDKGNAAASRYSVEVDLDAPTVTISGSTRVQPTAFQVSIAFSESVTGFEPADVMVGNGAVTALSGTGARYTATIMPSASGTVTVDVAAGAAVDTDGNGNLAAARFSVEADLDPPTVTISGPSATQAGPFDVSIAFSRVVTGFEPADVTVGNGAATALSGTGASYTATITPSASGTVTVDVASGAAQDEGDRDNTAASRYSVQAALVSPTVIISGPSATQTGPFTVTITFSEPVTGFERGDVTVGNGAVSSFSGSGASYRAGIKPTTASGTVTVDVAAGAAVDSNGDGNTAATRFSVEADPVAPTVSISGPTGAQPTSFEVSITFSEPVTGFEQADVTVGNGKIIAWAGSESAATLYIDPAATGTVTVDVAANVAVDAAGNGNTAATRFSVEADLDSPTVTISGPTTVQTGSFSMTIAFSEPVTGFEQEDVTVGNGRIWAWAYSASNALFYVAPAGSGTVTVDVAANVATDGDGNGNLAAAQFSVEADVEEPGVTISGPTEVQTGAFTVDIDFTESVTGFEQADVTVGNGRVTGWAETGGTTLAIITPDASGTVTVDVAARVAVNGNGYGNSAATQFSVEADLDPPTVAIEGPTGNQAGPFDVTIVFSEVVTGFEQADVTVGNGAVTAFSGSGASYTAKIKPTASGTVTVDVAAEVAKDQVDRDNTAASQYSVEAEFVDATVTISGPSTTQAGPFEVTITFSKAVTGFEQMEVTVGNGAVTAFSGSGTSYTATITPAATGTVTVDVAAGAAQDNVDRGNVAAGRYSVQADLVSPTVIISGPSAKQKGSFDVTITFSEAVTGFEQGEVTMGNGTVTALSGSGASYTATIRPAARGTVTVDVAAGVAVDSGNDGNTAASRYSVEADVGVKVAISGPSGEVTDMFVVSIRFSEPVTGFEQGDVTVGNGTIVHSVGHANLLYGFTVQPTATGTVTVDVAAGVAVNSGGYPNSAAQTFSVSAKVNPDRLTTHLTGPSDEQGGPFDVTITFSNAVTGFEKEDLGCFRGAVTAFSGSGASYTATITQTSTSGSVICSVEAGVAMDLSGNFNTKSNVMAVNSNLFRPATLITGPASARGGPFDVTITFSGNVTGFEQADVMVGNGTVTAFSGSGRSFTARSGEVYTDTYTATITPAATGTVTVDVAAGVAMAYRGGHGNTAAIRFSVEADLVDPTVTISGPPATQAGPFEVTITFSKPVTGFDQTDITVGNGAAGAFSGSGANYTATITPAATGTVTVDVAAGVAQDQGGRNNTAAGQYSVQAILDTPTVIISGPSATQIGPFAVTITFSESVTGFEQGEVTVGNGAVMAFSGSGASYTATITPAANGTVTVDVAAGVAADSGGDGNTAAFQYRVEANLDVPVSIDGPSGVVSEGFVVTITFSRPVTGFDKADVTVTQGEVASFSGSETTYQVGILPWVASGKVTVAVAAGVAVDPNGFENKAAQYSVEANMTRPVPVITGPTDPQNRPFEVTIFFLYAGVYEFDQGDVTVQNGTVVGWSREWNQKYKALINPSATGTVSVSVPENVAYKSGKIGDDSIVGNLASTVFEVEADLDGPLVGFRAPLCCYPGTDFIVVRGPFEVWYTFSEPVTGFEPGDVTVSNGSVTALTLEESPPTAHRGMIYKATITPLSTGEVVMSVPANAVVDAVGNGNRASTRYWVIAQLGPLTSAISGPTGVQTDPFDVTITFSEPTARPDHPRFRVFDRTDVVVGNGTVTAFSGSGKTFTATITPESSGTVTVDVPVGVTQNESSGDLFNLAAPQYSVQADLGDPRVTIADASADEGDALTFTVTLDKAVAGGLKVTPSFTDGTAVEGTDYTGNGAAVTFTGAAGEPRTFTVATIEDTDEESDKAFTVSLAVSEASRTVIAVDTATGTITDDDAEAPAVTIGGPAETQTGPFDLSITFSEPVTGFEQGDVTVGNGSVAVLVGSGADYTAIIKPESSGTVTVDVAADVAEDAVGYGNTAADQYSVEADLDPPTVTISGPVDPQTGLFPVAVRFSEAVTGFEKEDVTVGNGSVTAFSGSEMHYTATIKPESSGTVTVDVAADVAEDAVGHGNLAADQYSVSVELERPSAAISGPTGEQTGPFNVAITFSKPVTGFEQKEVMVRNGRVVRFGGGGNRYRATIAPESIGTVTVDVAENVAFDAGGRGNLAADQYSVRVVVYRPTTQITGPTDVQTGPFDVWFRFSEPVTEFEQGDVTVGNGAVTAFSGSAANYTATIEPESSGTVTVDVAAFVAFSAEGNGNLAADQYSVEVGYLQPKFTIADARADEGDAIAFTVTLNGDGADRLTVVPEFIDGTATLGVDYDPSGQALEFSGGGGETRSFTVATVEDAVIETDETFTVRLEVIPAQDNVIATDTATGTITDDDSAAVTIADASANEGGALTFTVTLDNAVSGGLTVTPSFTDGTATKGTDYTENTAALTFTGTAGETRTFTVSTTEDTVVEADEIFTVSLAVSNPSVMATDTATGTITEDDSAAVTIADASGEEGDSLTFTVTLDQAVSGGLTVTPRFTDVTATEGTDYQENTAALTFTGASGERQTFTVATIEDAVAEASESFTVSLAVSGTPARVTTTDTATGTIADDDSATVTIADGSATEGDAITFRLTLDEAVEGGLTVTPNFTDVTATERADYTENTAALTFTGKAGETRTFTVATIEDTAAEADETFAVRLSVSGTSAAVTAAYTAANAATGTIIDNDSAAVTIADAVAGEGYAPTFTVRLNKAVSGGLTVTPGFKDGTATKGADYTENRAALSFAGTVDETRSFAVPTIEDTDVETDETFTVSLKVSGTGTTVEADDTATGTILDDDLATVTIADASANEGDEITFTVRLDNAVSGGLTVTPSFSSGTATEGTDYTENTAELTFTGTTGETKTFTVPTVEDAVAEPDETFTVSLSVSGTSAAVVATDMATGTIDDDDSAAVTIENASAAEGDAITFTVTLDKAVSGGLKVTPTFTNGTAIGGTDYTDNTSVLTFTGTAWETKTFTVSTAEDAVVETNETFTVGLTVSGTSASVTATDTATGTITDDDSTAVTIADASANEGDSLSFTVTLDKAVAGGLKVTPGFTDVTATKSTDYTENTAVLTFAGTAGETKTFTVSTSEDTVVETNETFTVGLTVSGTSASVTATDTATGTITDDDSAAVTVNDASANEGDALSFTVTLDKAVAGGLKVTPSFTDVTATEGTDYTENTSALTFNGTAGETKTFTVPTAEDTVVEPDETFTVGLTASGTSVTVTASDTGTGTITNDDSAVVTIADASASEGDALSFTVTLDKAVAGGLKVTPGFTDVTATEGTDYTEDTAELTFTGTAGETKSFTVPTTEDTVVEPDETFTVGLTLSGTTLTVTATDTAVGTITNDDGSAAVTIANASAEEGDALTFTVTLDKAVAGGLKVTPGFTDVTATKGTDYTENTAALTFTGTAGETKTFTVSTAEDTVVEPDETFTVGLAVSGTTLTVTATGTATGTITNDDGSATVTIANASAAEGDALSFTVTLDKAVAGGLKVTPGYSDVTATEGTDYTENTAALTFAGTAGETKTFTVPTAEDTVVEPDETFTVGLAVSGTTLTVTATDTAVGTITNDDSAAVTIADASASEGDTLSFTVTLDKAVAGGLKVTPGFTDVTATKGTDYTENTAELTFTGTAGETKSFTVPTTEDTVVEPDETFTVGLTLSGTTLTVTATDTAVGTITNDDSAAVTIADASASEGDTLSFTVTLDKAVAGGLKVTPGFTDVTATKGTDYTENTAAVTFTGTAGETKSFTVVTAEDTDVEPAETFTVGLTVSGTSATVTATDTGTGTITDDDSAVVTIADASASEGDVIRFTVTLDEAVAGGLKVTPGYTDVTATKGTDYTENTAALTFTGTAGETKTFTVSTAEDTVVEPDETFTVGLAVSGTTLTVTATGTATGTITNDDSAAVTIADASASEGDTLSFTVTLDKAVAGGLKVTPGFTDVTATKGTDYTENTAVLTFTGTAGETKTFTVSTAEDTMVEPDETFTVGLTASGTSVTVTATGTASGTITDDDSAAVTIGNASAEEGGALTFTVTLDEAVAGGLKVTPGYTDVTATKGTDYTENTAALTFTGTAGETKTFTVSTAEDTVVEPDETFTVGLAVSGTTLTVTATGTATGTITNDDGSATVTIANASAAEGDALSFTVTLDKAVAGGLKVTPGFTDVTATKGTDYTENTAVLTFTGTAGETKTFTVLTAEDTMVEPDETFTVGLTASGTSVTVTATDTAAGTITDDDSAAVTIANASAEEGGALTFTVTLDQAVAGGLKVTPSYVDVTATKGTDYTENTAELTFTGTAGETKSFTVPTTEDTVVEPDETFTVGLTLSGTTLTVTATGTATGTITNDDGSAAVTIANASAEEGDALTFTVTLDKAVAGGLKVTPGYTDVTATKGTDYTENTAALTFTGTAGERKTFTVSTAEDAVVEPDETFTVGLTASGTSVTVTATDTAAGTVTDDDSAAVTIANASAEEGGALTFTVTLDQAVAGGLTVAPSYVDVTATKGTDYTENTAELTFTGTAGETKSFTVSTAEDTVVEPDETFTVGLTLSGTTLTVTATGTATGTITNDDGSATVTIANASAEEGDSLTFTVTLDKAVAGGLKVTPDFTDVTATKGTDYTENTAALTFTGTAGETKTFTVSTAEDTVVEPDETFTVGLTASGTSATVTATDTGTGTITDDDSAAVTIANASANEGEALTFTVTLDKAVAGGLKVTPAFTDVTATKGTDYTENTAALTFTGTAGETKTFTVSTAEDTVVESHETFTVGLTVSGTSASVTATDTGTGTITDDDSAAVTIADASASEGDAISFTVTLDQAVAGGLKVTPAFTDVTATKGTDYTENTAALTFTGTAGETKTFTVSTAEDTVVEPDETFTVGLTLSGTTLTVTATGTATGTITNDDGSATVTIANASAAEGDALSFTVTLDKAVAGGLKVTPAFTDVTATKGTDYTENTAVLTFTGTAGETKTFTVSTAEDTVVEPDETFTVGLTASGTSVTVTATDTAIGTIANDDSAVVTIANASAEEGDALSFTVTLDKAVAGGLKVTPDFTDVTATKGTDYTENTAALTFTGTAGETKTFTVSTAEDTDVEPAETFTVGLTVSGTSATVTATDTGTGTITDNDSSAVTIANASANEGEALTFTVTLDKAVAGGLKVTPDFTDVTATKGTDYTENTAALTFTGTAGETKSFTVVTAEDTDVEPAETLTVGLTVSGTSATVTATDTGTGTITDDDSAAVTIANASAEEGGALTFTVTLDKAVAGGLKVTPGFTDVTATEGTDYTENTSVLTFTGTAGETKTFTVSTAEDTVVEPARCRVGDEDTVVESHETFTVGLTVSGTSASVTATDTGTGTITDDDSAAVTIADASASEGDAISFTVTLDKAVAGGLKVTPDYTDVTATKGTDYTENTAALTFTGTAGETKTFTVSTAEDTVVEPDETFTVGLAVSGTTL